MKDKIMIFSAQKEVRDWIADSLGSIVHIQQFKADDKINEAEKIQFIFTGCNYHCSLSRCLKKFILFFHNRETPFAIVRPILLGKNIKPLSSFSLAIFENYDFSASQKNILDTLQESTRYAYPARRMMPTYPLFKIIEIQKEVIENPQRIYNLKNLSKVCSLSPPWLSLQFHKVAGFKLEEFLIRLRCCFALWNLISTNKLVKQIAIELGYKPLSLTKRFHSIFGVPPSLVRKEATSF